VRIETFINDISDKDEQWGPLLFIRPERHMTMGALRVLGLAVMLGGLFGMLGSIVLAMTARAMGKPVPPAHIMPAILTAIYFIVARLTLARAWNRRARRLAKLK
jgi:hypothetical protein